MLENLVPEPYLYALGWMIIHALWQIAGIGLLLWLSLALFNQKSAAFKYHLSLAALATITIAAIVTFNWQLNNQSMVPESTLSEAEWAYLYTQPDFLKQIDASQEASPEGMIIIRRIEKHIPLLVNVWLIGAFLFFFKTASGLADLRSLHRKSHSPVPDRLRLVVKQISKKLQVSRPIQILSSTHIDIPLTYGILKPVILIPSALLFQMSPTQLEAIIAHEMAHIKRHDYLVNLIQSILEMLFFFHPVFWWINHEAKKQREMACDEMAIALGANPKDLAYGLANVINHAQNHAPEMAMAAAKKQNPTLDRIKKIMGVKTSPTQPTTLSTITMMITFILGATLLVGASDQNSQSSEDLLLTQANTQTIDMEYQMVYNDDEADTIPKPTRKIIFIDSSANKGVDTLFFQKLTKQAEPIKYFEVLFQGTEGLVEGMGSLFEGTGSLFEGFNADLGNFSNLPQLELREIPMPNFNFDNMPKWEIGHEIFKNLLPDSTQLKELALIRVSLADSTFKMKLADKSKLSIEEWEQYQKLKNTELAKRKEKLSEQIEALRQERIAKTEEWKKTYEPKVKEFQEKMAEWEKQNQPKIEEYQARVKAWEKENQPKIEEFQRKMEEWQKANEEKMKAFQEKMEAWQKAHEAEMKALEQKLKEAQRKND